jgi:hypothetical protein
LYRYRLAAKIELNWVSAECAPRAIAGVRTVIATHDESYEKKRRGSSKSFLAAFELSLPFCTQTEIFDD